METCRVVWVPARRIPGRDWMMVRPRPEETVLFVSESADVTLATKREMQAAYAALIPAQRMLAAS